MQAVKALVVLQRSCLFVSFNLNFETDAIAVPKRLPHRGTYAEFQKLFRQSAGAGKY